MYVGCGIIDLSTFYYTFCCDSAHYKFMLQDYCISIVCVCSLTLSQSAAPSSQNERRSSPSDFITSMHVVILFVNVFQRYQMRVLPLFSAQQLFQKLK